MQIDIKKLPTPLTEGGEGIIYEIEKNKIFKLYKDTVNKTEKFKKLEILINKSLPKNIIAPIDLVFDKNNNFLGYTMKKIEAEDLKKLCNKKYIKMMNITVKDIIKILIEIRDTLSQLHKMNIYIGDLNDQNILIDNNFNIYFIDVDSWSIDKYKCTVCMDLFKDPNLISNNFNEKTDAYSFAILAFKLLTRLHPFGGTTNPEMNIMDRMKNKLSVLSNIKVNIPKMVEDFHFISPKLLDDMKNIFDNENRELLSNNLDDFINLTFCDKHKNYYYFKYKECPTCTGNNDIKLNPQKQTSSNQIPYFAYLSNNNIKIMINKDIYMNSNNEIVHIKSNKIQNYIKGKKYYFSNNGDIQYIVNDKNFIINNTYEIDKQYKSEVVVNDNKIYYINNNKLIELTITKMGNSQKILTSVSLNNIFEVCNNNYFVCNIHDNFKIININGYNYELKNTDKIINYNISYDEISKQWLFIYENEKNRFKTMIFNNNNLIYQEDNINYISSLLNICFNNNIIFKPGNKEILGFSYAKNMYKSFPCDIINEDSKLTAKGNKFIIINEKNIYEIG